MGSGDKGAKNQGKKKGTRGQILAYGIPVLLSICGPYIYYAIKINAYGKANAPQGYQMPRYEDIWIMLVSGVVLQCVRQLTHKVFYPVFYNVSKEQNDEEVRIKYARKASENLFGVFYFIFASFYGWMLLKDTPWLPWYLGGMQGGSFRNIQRDTLYFEYDQAVVTYSFVTWGFHF